MPNIEAWLGEDSPQQYAAMDDSALARFPYTASVSGSRGMVFGVVYTAVPFRIDLPSGPTGDMSEVNSAMAKPTGYYPQGYTLMANDQITYNGEIFTVVDVQTNQPPLGFFRVTLDQVTNS